MPILTLLTDFGGGSPYVAAMKGVILSIQPAATLVDITHDVPPQNVRQGALVLGDVAGRFPADTIHVAVVDPGVGTERAIVCARIGGQTFVAPDNGLLSLLAMRSPPERIVRVSNADYWLKPTSTTFHGRDILAPVAAHLALGLDPGALGPPHEKLVMLEWPQPRVLPGRIEGQVLQIDSFGNLGTNIPWALLASISPDCTIRGECKGRVTEVHAQAYGQHPPGTLIWLIGSNGHLEVAVVAGSAAARLGAVIGDPVIVDWTQ